MFNAESLANAPFLTKLWALAYVLEAFLVTDVPASLIADFVGGNGLAPSS